MNLVPSEYEGLFYVRYSDGVLSEDFTNKTRGKWYLRAFEKEQARIDATMPPNGPRKPVREFKLKLGGRVA